MCGIQREADLILIYVPNIFKVSYYFIYFLGFGLYSYLLVSVSGLIIISVVFVAYGNTIIVPTSACELGTTTAQRGILAAAPLIGKVSKF